MSSNSMSEPTHGRIRLARSPEETPPAATGRRHTDRNVAGSSGEQATWYPTRLVSCYPVVHVCMLLRSSTGDSA